MKRIFYSLLLTTALFAFEGVHANTITVKGTIKLTNGSAAKNTEVNIAVFLTGVTTSCSEQTVLTDNNGFYSKEMTCTGDIKRSRISLKNCDGAALVQEKEVTTTKIVEANFVVCQLPAATCSAKFTAEPAAPSSSVPPLSFKFNSITSETSSGETIAHRTWNFNDGSPLVTDRVDPIHTFPHPGTYEVCLTIKSSGGCESKVCKQITVLAPTPLVCTAKFTFERLGPKKFRFNSEASVTAANDNIISRNWDFKDGTTSTEVAPAHEFAKAGNYEVCLTIKTASGCESRMCIAVKTEEPGNDNSPVRIVSLYPTPVHDNLKAVVFSKNNNVLATLTVVSPSAAARPSQQVTLVAGDNPVIINVDGLPPGTYFLKLTTQYGTTSKLFYKL